MRRYHVWGNYEMEGHDCTVTENPEGGFVEFEDADNALSLAYLAAWSAEWRRQEAMRLVDRAYDMLDDAACVNLKRKDWYEVIDQWQSDANAAADALRKGER